MLTAPIALFAYNRPDHLAGTIGALAKNMHAAASDLYAYSDGPKNESDQENVARVRRSLRAIRGFRRVEIIERETNMGLANSLIAGITEVVGRCGRAIVMEDDLLTSPFFLAYLNEALDMYRDDERVASVHGYMYPVKARLPETFFLRGADCWGWATWKRGWDLFESNGAALLARLSEARLSGAFDLDGCYPYVQMLKDQIAGKNSSWAIRWHASVFLAGRLTLYPGRSLVHNTGVDGSGTHCQPTGMLATTSADHPVRVRPIPVLESRTVTRAIQLFYKPERATLFERLQQRFCLA